MPLQRIYHSPPHMSGRELEYIQDVIESNWVAPVGPHLARFEEMFCERIGVRHALAVTTGTAALHLALRHLQLQPGDEVLVPSATFWASVLPLLWVGGIPVFCESETEQLGLDPEGRYFVHVGTLTCWDGLDRVLEAIGPLPDGFETAELVARQRL